VNGGATGFLKKLRRKKWALRLAVAILIAPSIAWLAMTAAVIWLPYPTSDAQPTPSTLILDRNGTSLAAFTAGDGQWRFTLAENQISPHLMQAIVAVEDGRFYDHRGVDWWSLVGAALSDLRHARFVRGASTITMQVEHLRSPAPRTLANKLVQAFRARQLERRQSKSEILVEYLNRAPFGGNLTGAGAASWRYFGRSCKELSLGEAALLAGLPQSPNHLRPDRYPQRARQRRSHVLDRMLECGFIDSHQRDEAAGEPIAAEWRPLPQQAKAGNRADSDGLLPSLLSLAGKTPGGTLTTTIDASVQHQVAAASRKQLGLLEPSGIGAAAVVVLDTQTSQVLAAVTLGVSDSGLDLTRRPHSTGSTLKPFIYAAAFDIGICQPTTVLSDTKTSWAGYEPSDYDRDYRGALTAAEALAESRNIPAMLVLGRLGVDAAVGSMEAAGFKTLARSPVRYGLTLAIGGAEASPIELAQAYAALARGGEARPIQFILNQPPTLSSSSHFVRPNACWQVLNALSNSDRTRPVCPEAVASHVAWKTGTSSGHRDAWCAAVTRHRTVVVWLGNLHAEASASLVGQEAAAPLALSLIASLDQKEDPWPAASEPPVNAAPWRTRNSIDGLFIRSPTPGQHIMLATDVPRNRQRVSLVAERKAKKRASVAGTIWWFVDDQPIGTSEDSQRLWWEPVPGTHEIRAVDAQSGFATLKIQVHADAVRD
jgi:penicillin-binding protein 1C